MFRNIVICTALLGLSAGLAACSIIPLNTSVNIKLDDQPPGKFENAQIISGGMVASGDVPWWVPLDCRLKYRQTEVAIDAAKKSTNPKSKGPRAEEFWSEYCGAVDLDRDFIGLTLSGGGARAAVFAAAVMFELEAAEILRKVDVISSVSGGSMTAALYGLSCDSVDDCPATVEGSPRCLWRQDGKTGAAASQGREDLCQGGVFEQLAKKLETKFFVNLFRPDRVIRYWFTHYDRSDIMADIMSDDLYDNSTLGGESFRFQDLNPQRPSLIINATNFTKFRGPAHKDPDDGSWRSAVERLNFQFTGRVFKSDLCSDLDRYPLANAVMASAAFPGLFHYVTLTKFCKAEFDEGQTYKHLFDGGNSDNLGLLPFERMFDKEIREREANRSGRRTLQSPKHRLPENIVLLEVNASLGLPGKSPNDPDPRSVLDYVIDSNFIDTTDSLMVLGYSQIEDDIKGFLTKLECENGKGRFADGSRGECAEASQFVTIALTNLKRTAIPAGDILWRCVKEIGTRFQIERGQIKQLRLAAKILVQEKLYEICTNDQGQRKDWIGKCPLSVTRGEYKTRAEELCPG